MAYVNRLQNYHPSQILKVKRAQRFETQKAEEKAKSEEIKKKDIPVDEEEVLLKQAQDYLSSVSEGVSKILDKLGALNDLAEKSSKGSLDDEEKKAAIKEFSQKKNELDQFATTTSITGDLLFSGKFEMKGKMVKLDDTKEVELKIKSFDTKSLGVDRSRIDTKAVATKTIDEIAVATNFVTSTRNQLDQHLNYIANKLIAKEKSKKLDEEVSTGTTSSVRESYHMLDLKRRQEHMAEATGQTFGLLINLKV